MPKARTRLRRLEKLSFCPDCGKHFSNEANILRHMNQPSNVCGSLIQVDHSLISSLHVDRPCNIPVSAMESPLAYPCSSHHLGPSDVVDDFDLMPEHFDRYPDELELSLPLSPPELHLDPDPTTNVEYHPHAPQMFPGGRTFMGDFFSDEYALLRQQNLFYPFASQVEWQLGLWLLHSDLSMAAINGFLSLDLVSIHFFAVPSISLLGWQVKTLSISFRSARQLCLLAEMLPSGLVGCLFPCIWQSQQSAL